MEPEDAASVDKTEARRRKAFVLAKEVGLDRDSRIELAQYFLRRDITSWKGLSDAQIGRLLDAMEGFELIEHLLAEQFLRKDREVQPPIEEEPLL